MTVSWTKRPRLFLTLPIHKTLKQLLAFLNLYQHIKSHFTPLHLFILDICIYYIYISSDLAFLTMPTKMMSNQLFIFENLYQHAESQTILYFFSKDIKIQIQKIISSAHFPNFQGNFFFYNSQLYHVQLHTCFQHHAKIQKKLMTQFLENTWTGGWTDSVLQDPSRYCLLSNKILPKWGSKYFYSH